MLKNSLEQIIEGLNAAGVMYLVVGGLAVNAHGYVRATVDVDLILQFTAENLLAGVLVLKRLGYRPRVPVAIEDFADEEKRRSWVHDKGMTVFSLNSDGHQETEIDLFVSDPLGFEESYKRAISFEIKPHLSATVCSLADLIKLKEQAGRPKDKVDIDYLKKVNNLP